MRWWTNRGSITYFELDMHSLKINIKRVANMDNQAILFTKNYGIFGNIPNIVDKKFNLTSFMVVFCLSNFILILISTPDWLFVL